MTAIDPHIFRAYDIRGKALTQLTEEAVGRIARAFGDELRARYGTHQPKVCIGRDARTHGPVLEDAAVRGLRSAGCHVLRMGPTPSPVNYFTICTMHLDGGIQITASHNPKEDNGMKLQVRDAEAFSGEELQTLRQAIEQATDKEWQKNASGGSIQDVDALTPYMDHVTAMFPEAGKGLHVVIDGGNGIAGPTAVTVLERMGCRVDGLYIAPDGTFPHHAADPSKHATLKDLQDTVRSRKAHLGLAFDGDGDRVGLVDETGTIRTADELLLLLARDHLERHPGNPVIFTVSNSGVLESEIRRWGGTPVMCKVGHSFVEHAMRQHGALLGGEQSGHFFCGEGYFRFDDALVAALHIIRISARSGGPVSALFRAFPKVYQAPERRPHCPDNRKAEVIAAVIAHFSRTHPVNTLDGARVDFGDGAWAGIRMSNTSPCLSICIEARSPEKRDAVEREVLSFLQTFPEVQLHGD